VRIFQNDVFLCSLKDKRVENLHIKFHNIPSIFQFMVELAMHNGDWNERSVCKKKKNGTLVSLNLTFSRWARITLVGWLLVHAQTNPPKMSCQILSSHVKSKKLVTKKNMRLKGLTCITPINLWLLKIYSTIPGSIVTEIQFCHSNECCIK